MYQTCTLLQSLLSRATCLVMDDASIKKFGYFFLLKNGIIKLNRCSFFDLLNWFRLNSGASEIRLVHCECRGKERLTGDNSHRFWFFWHFALHQTKQRWNAPRLPTQPQTKQTKHRSGKMRLNQKHFSLNFLVPCLYFSTSHLPLVCDQKDPRETRKVENMSVTCSFSL